MQAILRRSLLAVSFTLLAACLNTAEPVAEQHPEEADPLPALPAPPSPVEAGGLILSATTGLLGDEANPPRVSVSVMARNITSDPASLEGLCVVQLRAFRQSTRTTEAAWKAPRPPIANCPPPVGPGAIPPGGKFFVHAAGRFEFPLARDILGDSLPEGRYAFGVLIRVGGDTVFVPAGTLPLSKDTRPPLHDPDLLRYAGEVRVEGVAPRELVARVVATNPSDRNVYLEYGACSLRLRAYRTRERTGRPVWRSEHRRSPFSNHGYMCPAYLATQLVVSGQVISPGEFNARIPLHEVLGDSLPDGRYYFAAVLEFQRGAGTTLAHDTVRLFAGSADLTSAIDPLPQERIAGGIRYRAETMPDPAARGMLRVTLSATNVSPDRVLLLGEQGVTCPTLLLGYRTEVRRDRWYMERSADWTSRSCPIRIPPYGSRPEKPGPSPALCPPTPGRRRRGGTISCSLSGPNRSPGGARAESCYLRAMPYCTEADDVGFGTASRAR